MQNDSIQGIHFTILASGHLKTGHSGYTAQNSYIFHKYALIVAGSFKKLTTDTYSKTSFQNL